MKVKFFKAERTANTVENNVCCERFGHQLLPLSTLECYCSFQIKPL